MAVNMNDKSKIRNLCTYPISWKKITSTGDEYIKASASMPIANFEIEAQVESGNVFLGGVDRLGSHAMTYIENEELREQLKFDDKAENRKQLIVDNEKCEYILNLKTFSSFKKNVEETIVTQHEKIKIIEVARKIKLNDYEKIKFLESYCKMTF